MRYPLSIKILHLYHKYRCKRSIKKYVKGLIDLKELTDKMKTSLPSKWLNSV